MIRFVAKQSLCTILLALDYLVIQVRVLIGLVGQ